MPPQTTLSLSSPHFSALHFLQSGEYQLIKQTLLLKHAPYLQSKLPTPICCLQPHFSALSCRLHTRILAQDTPDAPLSKMEYLWQVNQIPYFHRYYYLLIASTGHFSCLTRLFHNESSLLSLRQHICFTLHRLITARELCLRSLKRLVGVCSHADVHEHLFVLADRRCTKDKLEEKQNYQIQGYKVKIKLDYHEQQLGQTKIEQLSTVYKELVRLTCDTVQCIETWKQYIHSLTHVQKHQRVHLEYYYEGQNYLVKILNDNQFISSSVLNQFYTFAPKNDPFLLTPIIQLEKCQQIQYDLLNVIKHSKEQLPFVLDSLMVLYEEYHKYVKRKKVYDLTRRSESVKIVKSMKSLEKKSKDPFRSTINSFRVATYRHNPQLPYLKSEQIDNIKQNIINRLKEDKILTNEQLLKSTQKEVNRMLKAEESKVQYTPISMNMEEVVSYLITNRNQSCLQSKENVMEVSKVVKIIKESQFLYAIEAKRQGRWMGNVLCVIDKYQLTHKALKVIQCNYSAESILQELVLGFVSFIWKYQNADEIYLIFPKAKNFLQANSTVLMKSNEYRYVFKRKNTNGYTPLSDPRRIFLTQFLLFSKYTLQLPQQNFPSSYDLLLVYYLLNFVTSDQFRAFEQCYRDKVALRNLIEVILQSEKHALGVQVFQRTTASLSTLNSPLVEKYAGLDGGAGNHITMLWWEASLTLQYVVKVCREDAVDWLRYSVDGQLKCIREDGVEYWHVPCLERKTVAVLLWNHRQQGQLHRVIKSKGEFREVDNLYVQMEREQGGRIQQCKQFKNMYLGEQRVWGSEFRIQNGIKYTPMKKDVRIKKPYGIALVDNNMNFVMYETIIA